MTVLEPVRLEVDPALKGKARRQAAGAALYGVMSDLIFRTAPIDRTVFDAVVEAAEREGGARVALEDPVTGTLTYRRLLMGARVLGAKLGPLAPQGRAIGVMLPNANAAAVTVLGVMSAGRVPAMINFTAGPANILSACKAAEVETLVTSRAFVQKGRLDALLETLSQSLKIVYLEDVRSRVGRLDKLRGFLGWRQAIHPRKPEDPAAILFTSGSEGTPKGVVLSHRNMLANAAQAQARIDFGRTDKVFNVLPVFHSFGLTVGLVLPLVSGVPVYLYPRRCTTGSCPSWSTARTRPSCSAPTRSCRLRPGRPRLRLPLAALHPGRGRAGEAGDPQGLRRKVRPADPGGLRRHRDGAGAGAQHPDVQPLRHGRRVMPGMEARLEPVPASRKAGACSCAAPT